MTQTSSMRRQVRLDGWCSTATTGMRQSTDSSRSRPMTRSAPVESRPVVGSSASKRRGFPPPASSSHATESRRRSPPLRPVAVLDAPRSPTRRARTWSSPRLRSTRESSSSSTARLFMRMTKLSTSSTVSSEKNASFWGSTATSPSCTLTRQLRASRTRPVSCKPACRGSMPASADSSMVFPDPLGPMMAIRRPDSARPDVRPMICVSPAAQYRSCQRICGSGPSPAS
mmetsp:Transcript_13563/g.40198  ORF Transcript_13563/g.40198 Transcript_13563/m.40198 type:complete len:228 (+) Transcript_13563:363-1046(+)